jgi:signal transduction histidine kinase
LPPENIRVVRPAPGDQAATQPPAPNQTLPAAGAATGSAGYATPDAPQRFERPPPLILEPLPALPTDRPPPASASQALSAGDQQWRLGLAATDGVRIAIAVNAGVMDSDMRGTRNGFLLALPFALVLIGAGSWVFAGRALKPLQKLTNATRRITAVGLNQRIPAQGEDKEFAGLIDVFNSMLARLDRSFKQASRFSADAAHELKTPLAILQGQLERAIAQAEDGSVMQGNLTSILDEVQRLSTISRKLLLLSQADAGRLTIAGASFDMTAALQDLLEDTRMLAPHLQVNADIAPQLTVQGDASLLRQVLHNLISNAIKYNAPPEGTQGWIAIQAKRRLNGIEVVVSNASEGIASDLRDKVFERFFRVDSAHSRAVEGVGLGLSVSREIARAHSGDLTLQSDNKVSGAVHFVLRLPAASPLHLNQVLP